LASGKKTIEIRKWNTSYRGKFLIHASKNTNNEACSILRINEKMLVKGAIIGEAFLYDVKSYSSFDEFERDQDRHLSIEIKSSSSNDFKRYGFLVKDSLLFKNPIPCLGKLGIFEVNL
jgi:hypothetical protein